MSAGKLKAGSARSEEDEAIAMDQAILDYPPTPEGAGAGAGAAGAQEPAKKKQKMDPEREISELEDLARKDKDPEFLRRHREMMQVLNEGFERTNLMPVCACKDPRPQYMKLSRSAKKIAYVTNPRADFLQKALAKGIETAMANAAKGFGTPESVNALIHGIDKVDEKMMEINQGCGQFYLCCRNKKMGDKTKCTFRKLEEYPKLVEILKEECKWMLDVGPHVDLLSPEFANVCMAISSDPEWIPLLYTREQKRLMELRGGQSLSSSNSLVRAGKK